jgi:hypothetical protein
MQRGVRRLPPGRRVGGQLPRHFRTNRRICPATRGAEHDHERKVFYAHTFSFVIMEYLCGG